MLRRAYRRWLLMLGFVPFLVGAGGEAEKLALLERLVMDDSPAVRVEALRALAKIPTARSAELALRVLDRPMDPTLDYALWLTINDLAEPWVAALRSGAWSPEGREKQLEFALKALPPARVGLVLGDVLGDRLLARDGRGPWIEIIGSAGTPRELGRLWGQVVDEGFDVSATTRSLTALAEAARLRRVKPAGDLSALGRYFAPESVPEVRMAAIRLAGQWRDIGTAVDRLIGWAMAPEAGAMDRNAAFDALRQIGGDSVVRALAKVGETSVDSAVGRAAAVTLAALEGTLGFPAVAKAAERLEDEGSALEFWRSVMAIRGASAPLQEALEGRRLSPACARAGMRVSREAGREDLALASAFAKAGGLAAETGTWTGEMAREIAARALETGDPRRGERVFRRTELACVTCHAIGGAGGKVGPDLTSIGASAPPDYLVESLLLPSAKIKEGYHSVVVETVDGEEFTGTVARESPEELVLRSASGQEVPVAKSTIRARENGRLSMMPSGLVETLPEQDRSDLVAFLSRLGKPGEFDASRGGVARRWYLGNLVHTDVQNHQEDWIWKAPLTDRRWVSMLALAGGNLESDLLDAALAGQPWMSKVAVIAATEFTRLPGAGPVRLRANLPDAELWVDGRRWSADGETLSGAETSRHRVVVRMDPRRVPERLRLEIEGGTFVLD